jgi:hypothetical protein
MRKYLVALALLATVATASLLWLPRAITQQGGQLPNGGGGTIQGPNGNPATVNGNNEMRVNIEGQQVFGDTFDLPVAAPVLNTTQNWTVTSGGGGVAAALNGTGTNNAGSVGLASGTTAGGFSCITGKVSYAPVPPGFLVYGFRVQLPAALPVNTYAFWGISASQIASPTVASPLTEGLGIEVTTTGKMQTVSYAAPGGRTLITDLSATGTNRQPTDGATYTYYEYFRGDKFYWAITDQDNIVSTGTGAQGPNINPSRPMICAMAQAGAVSSLALTVSSVFVGDNGHNNIGLTPYNYFNMTTGTTSLVKSGSGFLHNVCINTPAAGTLLVLDSLTGAGVHIGQLTEVAAQAPNCSIFDVQFSTGLTLSTTVAGDVTASYR